MHKNNMDTSEKVSGVEGKKKKKKKKRGKKESERDRELY
jgi:hypothetical protein